MADYLRFCSSLAGRKREWKWNNITKTHTICTLYMSSMSQKAKKDGHKLTANSLERMVEIKKKSILKMG